MLNLKASIDALICSIEEQENRRAEIVGKVSRMKYVMSTVMVMSMDILHLARMKQTRLVYCVKYYRKLWRWRVINTHTCNVRDGGDGGGDE